LTRIVGGLAVILSVIVPGGTFFYLYQQEYAKTTEMLQFGADSVSEYIATRPEGWIYLKEKLRAIIERTAIGHGAYSYRLLDGDGGIVLERVMPPAWQWPMLTTTVTDGLRPVGRFDVVVPLKQALLDTAIAALIGLCLSAFLIYLFQRIVLRFIDATLHQLLMAERKLAHMNKVESLGTLVGGIAHNFNNLLQPIISLTELTLNKLPVNSAEHKNLEIIAMAGNQAKALVLKITAFSRQEIMDQEVVDLRRVIEDPLSLIRATIPSSIRIVEKLDDVECPVLADSTQLATVLINLFTNAIDAIGTRGGEIALSLSKIDISGTSSDDVIKLAPGAYAKLTVADTGSGMDEATLERVFDPFFTTKETDKGTGLGLFSAYGIIAKHGGTMHASSHVGLGAVFEIYLPIDKSV